MATLAAATAAAAPPPQDSAAAGEKGIQAEEAKKAAFPVPPEVLPVIFTFLDVKTLCAVDMSSKVLAAATGPGWAMRDAGEANPTPRDIHSHETDDGTSSSSSAKKDQRLIALQTSKSLDLTPKQRLERFYVARSFCRRMVKIAGSHFRFGARGIIMAQACKCPGCDELPDLFTGAHEEGKLEEYEFFVRVASLWEPNTVRWEGFVPGKPSDLGSSFGHVGGSSFLLDMSGIHKKGEFPWEGNFLNKFLREPLSMQNEWEDGFIDIAVTVAAMKRNDPAAVPELVVSTAGFCSVTYDDFGNLFVYQQARNVRSHKPFPWGAIDDELVLSHLVCKPIQGAAATTESHEFIGIELRLTKHPNAA